ncbi:methyl-accepting chemotaxis protein [Sulfuriflexus mobilis]|uniref:methyl-accepting chemotaxis protein n=1 Tax=Sulfuriflexus mobilis TaxID=1811807 RepID=UPI000F842D10|nr:methyl-accepting chemotaxis protein [Sulfuriflexus mobilis]
MKNVKNVLDFSKLKAYKLTALAVGIGISFVLMAGFLGYNTTQTSYDAKYLTNAGEQRVLSQTMSRFAIEASQGDENSFAQLQQLRNEFETSFNTLSLGDQITGFGKSPESVSMQLDAVGSTWAEYRDNIDAILQRKDAILSLGQSVQAISDNIPNLLALSDEVVGILIETGAAPQQIYIASRQLMLTQRIANNVTRVVQGGQGAATAADRFGRDTALFGRVHRGMLKGDRRLRIVQVDDPDARDKLTEVGEVLKVITDLVGKVLEASPELFLVHDAADQASLKSGVLLGNLTTLIDDYNAYIAGRITPVAGGLFGILTLVLSGLFVFLYTQDAKSRQAAAEATTRRNQEAIMRLLNEMADLADGDLTVQATVTEDITGAIADSVNFTTDALRNLVTSINEASVQVSSASQETQATAMHLAEASDHQAQQITGASTAINEMAVSIEDVSRNASESAEVARRSVETARKGATTVQDNIRGMDTIREQIQETSKRIKRLGESSQEIGDIVELINDIADQTNILALNAAIQAAMAGEQGRGFAVVADEVQRLAERSSNATKQIEALVKTIQTDTNEAVISMEHSTANVVSGAKLAEDAGQALEEIENVSGQLADLINNISDTAHQQSTAATSISETMNVIQEITTQTSAGTNETATSIGNLAELANELRRSVSGFKLPG